MSTTLHTVFRANVEAHLDGKGWTQSHLAEEMGVTPSYISQILSGHRGVAFEALEKVAKALGVAPDTLIKARPRRARSA